MKTRLVSILVLVAACFTLAAAPASANTPVPGIKQTPVFKQLKGYVEFLFERRNQPVNSTKRKTFRANLAKYRQNASLKVDQLFSMRTMRIARQDDAQERRQVKRIRVNQSRQVKLHQRNLSRRLSALKSKQNAAITKVYNKYQPQINRLADRRSFLQMQRDRATDPVRKANLNRRILAIQTRINAVVDERTSDANAVNSRYSIRSTSIKNLYNAKISAIRARSKKQIQQTRNAWRQTFRTQLQAAKSTRAAEKDVVSTVAARGSGYITQMPPAGN